MARKQVWNIVAFVLCMVGSILVIIGMLRQVSGSPAGLSLVYIGGAGISVAIGIYIVMAFSRK